MVGPPLTIPGSDHNWRSAARPGVDPYADTMRAMVVRKANISRLIAPVARCFLRCRCREHGRLRGRHVPPHDGAPRAALPRFITHSRCRGAPSTTNVAEWIHSLAGSLPGAGGCRRGWSRQRSTCRSGHVEPMPCRGFDLRWVGECRHCFIDRILDNAKRSNRCRKWRSSVSERRLRAVSARCLDDRFGRGGR